MQNTTLQLGPNPSPSPAFGTEAVDLAANVAALAAANYGAANYGVPPEHQRAFVAAVAARIAAALEAGEALY